MNPRDIFGVLVRAGGLWLIVQSAMMTYAAFSAPIFIVAMAIESGIGCVLLFGADYIVRAAYDRSPSTEFNAPLIQQ
jgi:hypothetical protein